MQSPPKLMVAPKRAKLVAKSNHNITEKALQELREISNKLDETPEDKEFDCFGKTVACMLKKLPEELALESMSHIQIYLAQQRLKKTIIPHNFTSPITENAHSLSSSFSLTTSSYSIYDSPNYSIDLPINTFTHSRNENSQNAQSDLLPKAIAQILSDE